MGAGRLGGWVSYAGWLAGLGVAGKVVFRCLHGGGICAAYCSVLPAACVQTSSPHLQTNAEFSGCRSAALVVLEYNTTIVGHSLQVPYYNVQLLYGPNRTV